MPRNIATVEAASLVLDYGLYPRHKTDSQKVREMVEAMQAGAVFPPVIACRSTHRVIDGFHRINAVLRAYGAQAPIKVEWRDYANDAERFADAMALNANHGQKLSRWDQTMCLVKAQTLGLPTEQAAAALSIPLDRAQQLLVTRTATDSHQEPYTLKRTMQHMAGQTLTVEQEKYNEQAGGLNQLFYVRQVSLMLEAKAEDKANEALEEALKHLYALLGQRYP